MTRDEFRLFAAALRTYYARESALLPNAEALELWYRQLRDIPQEIALLVLEKWVATQKWSPSIAEIRAAAVEIASGSAGSATWGDGWRTVLEAVRRYGIYDEARALDSMDEITRRAVRGIGWREICLSEDIGRERANFRMLWERISERERERSLLPEQLTARIDAAAERALLHD